MVIAQAGTVSQDLSNAGAPIYIPNASRQASHNSSEQVKHSPEILNLEGSQPVFTIQDQQRQQQQSSQHHQQHQQQLPSPQTAGPQMLHTRSEDQREITQVLESALQQGSSNHEVSRSTTDHERQQNSAAPDVATPVPQLQQEPVAVSQSSPDRLEGNARQGTAIEPASLVAGSHSDIEPVKTPMEESAVPDATYPQDEHRINISEGTSTRAVTPSSRDRDIAPQSMSSSQRVPLQSAACYDTPTLSKPSDDDLIELAALLKQGEAGLGSALELVQPLLRKPTGQTSGDAASVSTQEAVRFLLEVMAVMEANSQSSNSSRKLG
eukprot:TRINITY_DN11394_c0_g1_i2.p1 TRINITY_DN11394_c0_g1~~TRINITY_DN11394_c0_g1_i2.p1  ORF type:complete len:323 (+),score=69.29 TRINITY_DN11394_c0_g1_i2:800-1768(+)